MYEHYGAELQYVHVYVVHLTGCNVGIAVLDGIVWMVSSFSGGIVSGLNRLQEEE